MTNPYHWIWLLLIYRQMSDHLGVDFQSINDENELKSVAESVSFMLNEAGSRDEKALKQTITDLLANIHTQITNPSSSPKSKFMSLLMLREFTEKHAMAERKEDKHNKLFSILASHALTKELRSIAGEVDPMKQISDKGKGYFPSNSIVGNDFVRLVLELIRFWASRFPNTSKKQPTTYKRYFDELVDRKVVFPTEYKFLTFANKKSPEEAMYETGRQKPAMQSQPSTLGAPPLPPPASSSRSTAKTEIYRMYNRLINFVETLDQQISTVEPEIRTVHNQIKSDQKKYEQMQEEVLGMAERENDGDIVAKYFALIDFMQKELQYHQQYISNSNDYQSYILAIKLEAEKNFPQLNNNQQGSSPNPYVVESKVIDKPPKPKDNSKVASSMPEPRQSQKPARQSAFDPKATVQISSFFNKLQQRSKSPITGFRKINESLSREKSTTIKRSVSPINVSKNITKSMASLKESKVSPIFTNPPNLRPPPKTYEGREIRQNDALGATLKVITKSQGLRRFKTANFKGKSSLFENEHLQIGYKSQAIYEQVSGFKVLIKVELYFGNLTDQRIQNLALQFKGDPNILLYANPRAIETSLLRGDQNKIDLMIVPLKVPFPLLTMTVRYDLRGQPVDHRVIIPNSVLKLAHYMGIPKDDFGRRWQTADILHTSETRLCHYLPPDTFTKWIPELGELTSYTAFALPGSVKDYELYCAVIMLQRHEALLKINVRPNLEVIIQLGLEDRNEQSTQYFTYFLETLQQLLKEVA